MEQFQYCKAKNKHIKTLLIKLAREAGLKEDNKACGENRINSYDIHHSYFFINDESNKGFGLGCDMGEYDSYKPISLEEMIEILSKPQYIDCLINNQIMKYHIESNTFYLGGYSLPIDELKQIIKEVEESNAP